MRLPALAVLLLASAASADPGKVGADFLRIMPSPRAVGMGESGTALADDHLSALSLNPAGLARLSYPEASFLYNSWIEGVSLQNLAYAHPTRRRGTWAVSGTLLQVTPIPAYDNSGGSQGTVKAQDLAVKADYAKRLWGPERDERLGLFAGAGVKYVRAQLETASASAVMGDGGLLYAHPVKKATLGLGLSVESVGQGLRFDTERDPPPTVMRFGASYGLPVGEDRLSLVWDARKPRYEKASHGLGAEYAMKHLLFWRVGWTSEGDLGAGLRFGVGFRLKVFSLDYALAQFGDFGFSHRIALSMRFGAPPEVVMRVETQEERVLFHIRKGDLLTEEKRYTQAAMEYQEALNLDPHDKRTLDKMRRLLELMENTR